MMNALLDNITFYGIDFTMDLFFSVKSKLLEMESEIEISLVKRMQYILWNVQFI